MITGKQRSYLKGIAQELEPMASIGKLGLTSNVVDSIDKYLAAHELIKVKIQDGSPLKPKDVCEELAYRLRAEFVQAIGKKFVLYRQAKDKDKREIELPN